MRDHDLPVVAPDCPATEMIHAISKGGLGLIVICEGDRIEGIVTDGDVRRAMERLRGEFFNIKAADIATPHPNDRPDREAIEAEKMMTRNKVTSLLVTDEAGKLIGVIQIYDIKALSLRSRTDTQKRNPIVGFLFLMREGWVIRPLRVGKWPRRFFELPGDLQSQDGRRYELPRLDGIDRLAAYPDGLGQLLLGHAPFGTFDPDPILHVRPLSESPQHDPFDDEEEHGQQA